ncbi:DEAD/DEAH box helicase [Nocardia sp. NPDC023988]|uniref:DEAD/DEAH box helicase n=1 Tax=unclassified Nocardia TaxID=2637762 RepID=UPI0033DF3C34
MTPSERLEQGRSDRGGGSSRWDLDQDDWETLRDELSVLYGSEESRRSFARDLNFPPEDIPNASNSRDFWDSFRQTAEDGAVPWDFRMVVETVRKRRRYNDRINNLWVKYVDHGEALESLTESPSEAREAMTVQSNPDSIFEAISGEVLTDVVHSVGGEGTVRGSPEYSKLLPGSKQQDRKDAIMSLWEERLGPWDRLDKFQRELIGVCRSVIDNRGVALVYAVTNSGKTTIARAGMTMVLNDGKSAMMLLPTKALVAQEETEWNSWLGSREPLKKLQVYGVSRDHPESDRPVSGGYYSIAVAIYEKLGVYLVNCLNPLEGAGLVVVDELQMLTERSERAAKLEALLTLIKLRIGDEQPALMGLSAALTPEAGTALAAWLGRGRTVYTPTSNNRPVPLDTYVVDQKNWLIQRDAHLLSMPGDAAPEPEQEEPHELSELRKRYAQPLSKGLDGLQGTLSTAELAVTLVLSMLSEDNSRRIICFVPTRTAAKQLAEAIRKVLEYSTGGRLQRGSPWMVGRYKSSLSADRDEAENLYSRLRTSDIPDYDEVIRGMRTGVAFHTAALAPPLRRMLEEEFRAEDGLLRVLVATDTLAVGLNLPADTVIATSITGLTGTATDGVRQVLLPADLDNKGGRAGRRGKGTAARGTFYILVPSDRELQQVDGLSSAEVDALSSLRGVFQRFVKSKERSSKVQSQYRDADAISGLVLQVLCQDDWGRPRIQWVSRVKVILENLLISYEPEHPALPTPEDILANLQTRGMIEEVASSTIPGAGTRLKLTPVGHAVGRSGLELDDAPELLRLAERARSGSGTIDLLWHACQARSIRKVTTWVSLPGKGSSRHMPSLKEAVQSMALAHCAESDTQREACVDWVAAEGARLPERLLDPCNAVVSDELRNLLVSNEEGAPLDGVNALLRALVAYEWMNGVRFAEMKQRFSGTIRSEEEPDRGRPSAPSVPLHYSDIEQLCEQMAGYLRAAAEISVTDDGVDHSGRMQMIAQQVESGLPVWLAKVSRMRISGLHRERLAKLANIPEEHQMVPLSKLVDAVQLGDGLSAAEREHARRIIDNRVDQERQHRERLTREWASVPVPDGDGTYFDDISGELEQAVGSRPYLATLCELVGWLGITAEAAVHEGQYLSSVWSADGAESLKVLVPATELTGEMVVAVAEDRVLVVVRDRRPGAFGLLGTQGSRARFLEPDHLLSVLAHLVKHRGTVPGREVIDELRKIRVSSLGAGSWSVNPIQT